MQQENSQHIAVLSAFLSKNAPAPTARGITDYLRRSRSKKTLDLEQVQTALDEMIAEGRIIALNGMRDDIRYLRVDKLTSKRGWYTNPAVLLRIIHPEHYTTVFSAINSGLASKNSVSVDEICTGLTRYHHAVVLLIIKSAIAAGIISIEDHSLRYAKRQGADNLTHGTVLSRLLATEQLGLRTSVEGLQSKLTALERLLVAQKVQREESIMPTVTISTNQTPRVLAIGEMLLGHRLSDVEFVVQLIGWLSNLSDDKKPDVVLLSGLLFGEFKFTQKNMRPVVLQGFASIGKQMEIAFDFLSRLQIACPNTVILVNTDKYYTNIATSMTYAVLFQLRRSKEGKSVDTMLTNYKQLDKLHEQAEEWDFHYQFCYSVIIPFLIRSGRGLRSDMQMEAETGVATEEYFILLDMYQRMITGQKVEPIPGINPDYLPLFTRLRKVYRLFTLIDNARVTLQPKHGSKVIIDVYTQMTLTDATIPPDPLAVPVRIYGQVLNNNGVRPDSVLMLGGHVPTSVIGHDIWFVSPSSPLAAVSAYNQKRFYGNISGNAAHRLVYSTRAQTQAGSTMLRWYPDGSRSTIFLTKRWIDRSDVTPQRKYVVWIGDLQTGSPTALLDVYVQALSYVFNYLTQEGEVYLVFGGDMVQGRNYPGFVTESPGIPLARIEDQMNVVKWITHNSVFEALRSNMHSIVGVAAVPGNHEWNYAGGYGSLGALFTDYLTSIFDEYNRWCNGIIDINRYGHTVRKDANAFQHWMVTVDDFIPGVRLGFQHLLMERMKGAPGPGRSVMQMRSLVEGVVAFVQSLDVFGTGHWHNPQHLMVGDTVGIINPALAGPSGYEILRAMGVSPISQGISVMGFGGGIPFEWRVMTAAALRQYPVKGFFSDANLAEMGFTTDPGWSPLLHGMNCLPGDPRSAVQKVIRNQMFRIVYGADGQSRVVDLR